MSSKSPIEFARERGMGLSTVYLRIRQGKLRAVKDGCLTRILDKDEAAYDAALPAIVPYPDRARAS
jgi:hypothetical protein